MILNGLPARMPRRRAGMIAYLSGHFRYDSMHSLNVANSYANRIKIHGLNLTRPQADACYAMLDVQDAFEESGFSWRLGEFDRIHDWQWQIGTNGRSGGYLVLYQVGRKHTGHWSHCTACGQRNCQLVPPAEPTPEEHIRLLAHRHDSWSVDEIFKHYADKADPAVAFFGNSREVVIHLLANERQAVKDGAKPRISTDNRCGKCGAMARVNYDPKHLPFQSFTWPGKGVDMDEDFE